MKKRTDVKEIVEKMFPDLKYISESGRNIIVRDKYGDLKVRKDVILSGKHPSSRSAVDKNSYYKNVLSDKHPEIFEQIKIISEIKGTKDKIICETKWGLTKTTYDQLLQGYIPVYINSAINKQEFLRNKLIDLYKEYNYDFKIIDDEYSYLICPIHGKIPIKNELLLKGKLCPQCVDDSGSNIIYLIKLSNKNEEFYKIGVSRNTYRGISRYYSYSAIGYSINPIYEITFNSETEARKLEQLVKKYIKDSIYNPIIWSPNKSQETFASDKLLDVLDIIQEFIRENKNIINIDNYDQRSK